jgi:hypothetical protein
MVFQVHPFWDHAGNGFQIILFLLILCLYIRNRAIHKKYAVSQTNHHSGKSFNAHVFNLAVQQQVNQIFSNIIETIAAERNGLESVLGLNPLNSQNEDSSKLNSDSRLQNPHDDHRISDDRNKRAARHEKIRKLAAKGLSTTKISKGLKIPMSEVELVLSLPKK